MRSTADESFRSNMLAIREKHAFADFYALLAARTRARTRVYGTRGEKHLTRIGTVNDDAFRKRRDENVRVGQHSVSDSGSSPATIEHQMRMCRVDVVASSSLSSLLERVTYTKKEKRKKEEEISRPRRGSVSRAFPPQ